MVAKQTLVVVLDLPESYTNWRHTCVQTRGLEKLGVEMTSSTLPRPHRRAFVASASAIGRAGLCGLHSLDAAADLPAAIENLRTNKAISEIAGIRGGCNELIANESVRSIRDWRDKTVAISNPGGDHIMLSSMIKTSPNKLIGQGTDWRFLIE